MTLAASYGKPRALPRSDSPGGETAPDGGGATRARWYKSAPDRAERWQSGRMRRLAKPVYLQGYPGFESRSLRHSSLRGLTLALG